MFVTRSIRFYHLATAVTGCIILLSLAGCHTNEIIPLPADDEYIPQPKTYPLELQKPQSLTWPDPKPLTAEQAKFDYNNLPTQLFDSAGAQPFAIQPEQVRIDWNKLPVSDFSLDSFPEFVPVFRTTVLDAPEVAKMNKPVLRNQQSEMIFDYGNPFNQGSAQALLTTRDGLTWVAYFGKLLRFDGETISTFTISGLSSSVMSLFEDHNGVIWLASRNNGLFAIDLKKGIVRQLTATSLATSKVQGAVNCFVEVFEDEQNRLWLSSIPEDYSIPTNREDCVLYLLNDSTQKIRVISNGLSKNSAVSITQDHEKNIWVTTATGGVNIIDLRNNKIRFLDSLNGLPEKHILVARQDKTGRMFLVSAFGTLSVLDRSRTRLTRFTPDQGYKPAFTAHMMIDSRNNIWICGNGSGARVLDSSLQYAKTFDRTNGLNATTATSLAEDSRQQVLIGNELGLNMIRKGGLPVKHVGSAQVSTMIEDSRGRIWIGTLDNGIQIVDRSTGIARISDKTHGLSDHLIQYITEYNGSIILSTQKGGIEIIDTSLTKIDRIGPAQGLRDRNITSILPDSNKIWLSGQGYGIDIIDVKQKTVQTIGAGNGLRDSAILDLKMDRNGNILFWSYSDGIGIINVKNKTLQRFKPSKFKAITGVLEDNLLMTDSKGNTWLSTSTEGVLMINAKHDSVTQFSRSTGLAHNVVMYLREDQETGAIYVGTRLGVNILQNEMVNGMRRWMVSLTGRSAGISKVVSSYNSDLVLKNGDYWWGDNGITMISHSAKVPGDSTAPGTFITGLDILGRKQLFMARPSPGGSDTIRTSDSFYLGNKTPVPTSASNSYGLTWDSLVGPYSIPANLSLPYDKNYLQFHFAQVNFGSSDTTWYRYYFEGIDKKWSVRTSGDMTENYPNIPPGNYKFKVSSLYNGRWSEPAVLSFTILPPWWKTWWAYLLYILVAGLALRSWVSYRSRRLKRENRILEDKVTLRTEQLQQSLEDLRSTQSQLVQSEKMASLGTLTAGIAHEIQNPLNFVNNFSEVSIELLDEMKTEIGKGDWNEVTAIIEDLKQNLDKINHHGKRADSIVKGMLQHSRTSSGQKEKVMLNLLADEYLRLAYHGLRAKDKSFNATMKTEFDENVGTVNVVPQEIGGVILNLINNAFYTVTEKKKQMGNGFLPTVTIITKRLSNKTELQIKDNGNGIPKDYLEKIFQPFFTTKPTGEGTGLGLSLAFDVVKAHGGELKVDTVPGEGSTFTILLPAN